MPEPIKDRLGIAATEYFFSENGWLFREQPTNDYGIDAHVEIVAEQHPTGKLIALQIKSGKSYFEEETEHAYIFRTDDKHVAYWVNHSMPVVLILFDPDTKQAYWQPISRETVESTGKQWKVLVPKTNTIDKSEYTLSGFASLTQPEPCIRRLNRLRVDRKWMDLIAEGDVVRVQFDDWVNKSLSRYQVTILTDSEEEKWPMLYNPGIGIEGMLEHYFPWATFTMDVDAYYQARDDGWYETPEDIVPISDNGETESYSLILSLNEFGKSFLDLDDYLVDQDSPEHIGFTLE